MPSAEIISIGTELLLGEIVDTNAQVIARKLRDLGIDLYRKTTIGDNQERIALEIQQALTRCQILLTTGGLGPTIDDPTRAAIAQALGVNLEYRPELWDQIQDRFQRFNRTPTENNKRQAYIPSGALPVENPVGTAPAFILDTGQQVIISLPGVPREMEYLLDHSILPFLRRRFNLSGIIKARILHTSGVGESLIDDRLGDLEQLSNPTVGLAAHSGQVDIRITAKAASEAKADELIAGLEAEIRNRVGDWIFGADRETLEEAARASLRRAGESLAVVEAGLEGELIRRLGEIDGVFRGGEALPENPGIEALVSTTAEVRWRLAAQVGLGVALQPGAETQTVYLALITPQSSETFTRSYGGPPQYGPGWAIVSGLDLLRKVELRRSNERP